MSGHAPNNLVCTGIGEVGRLLESKGRSYGSLTITLPDSSAARIPFAMVCNDSGPVVVLLAGIHGNEWNSIACALQVVSLLETEEPLGRILCLPVVNLEAFRSRSRVSPVDQVDMNRIFDFATENEGHSVAIAKEIWENIIMRSDYMVDIHSGGDGDLLPHVRICNRKAGQLAGFFLTEYVQVYEDLPKGFLVKACDEKGLHAFGLELGRGLTLQDDVIAQGAKGTINFLKAVRAIAGTATVGEPKAITPGRKIRAEHDCLFWPVVRRGATVKKGEIFAYIDVVDRWARHELIADSEGLVLYVHRKGAATASDTLVEIVADSKSVHASDR